MPETSLQIRSDSQNRVRVEATEVKAEEGSAYPRLLVPARLDLNPIEGKIAFSILGVQASLGSPDAPGRLADALPILTPFSVTYPNASTTYNLEFPLDHYRIKALEERRSGDLKVRLEIHFLVGLYENLPVQTKDGSGTRNFLMGFETPFVALSLEVPQSHWVAKVLPALGYREYFLVEIPKRGKQVIQAAWNLVAKADDAFARWDTKSVYAHCREVGTLLERTVKEKLGGASFAYAEKWSRANEKFNHFASLDLHLEDIHRSAKYGTGDVKVNKADAEHLLIGTKSLVKYAEELLD